MPRTKPASPLPQKQMLKLIIGSELHLTDADDAPFCTLIALATNRDGYGISVGADFGRAFALAEGHV